MILFVPAMLGVVVDKDTAIPAAIETLGTTVKALGGLVKKHIARGEDDFMRISMEVLADKKVGIKRDEISQVE